jgi:hypothetical protein
MVRKGMPRWDLRRFFPARVTSSEDSALGARFVSRPGPDTPARSRWHAPALSTGRLSPRIAAVKGPRRATGRVRLQRAP